MFRVNQGATGVSSRGLRVYLIKDGVKQLLGFEVRGVGLSLKTSAVQLKLPLDR